VEEPSAVDPADVEEPSAVDLADVEEPSTRVRAPKAITSAPRTSFVPPPEHTVCSGGRTLRRPGEEPVHTPPSGRGASEGSEGAKRGIVSEELRATELRAREEAEDPSLVEAGEASRDAAPTLEASAGNAVGSEGVAESRSESRAES